MVMTTTTQQDPRPEDLNKIEPGLAPAQKENSFIRLVSRSFRSNRLGDILVQSGLIDETQLSRALQIQKETGEQLGKVLVRQKYVSGVQLYRKLAEQWCVKASAAGIALMVQTITPSVARADDSDLNGVRLASAFSPAAIKPAMPKTSYPELFNTTEIRSNDISAFTKWTSVMARFEKQMVSTSSINPRVQVWKSALQSLKGKSITEQVKGVDSYVNSVRYIEDKQNYGKSDYWATPIEFFTKGGDCEDFAIAKYASLRALGFSSDQMRIAIVQDKIKNVPHAILIVYTDEGNFVLDNQEKRTHVASEVVRYKPIFSINSTNWWLHKA